MLAQLGFTPWYPGLLARFSGWPPLAAVAAWLPLAALGALGWAAWGVAARVFGYGCGLLTLVALGVRLRPAARRAAARRA